MNKTQFEFPPCPECGTNGPIQNDITGTKFCNNENCNVWFYFENLLKLNYPKVNQG